MKKETTKYISKQETRIKFVPKAKMWCKTYWESNKQKQSWHTEKP